MAAQVFGTNAVVLQLNQAFRGTAPSNAVFVSQKEAVAEMGASAFAQEFAAAYVPAGAESAEDFAALANSILANLNLTAPTVAADKAADLADALPQLLFAYQDSIGQVVLNLTNLLRNLEGDANWGNAATLYNQQQLAALQHSADPDSANESGEPGSSASLVLTVGQDGITGTGADDTFVSNVVQNSLGAQVNTLGSGDMLDGAAGVDTLMAKIATGVFAGGSWSMPIQPETESIEIVNLEAVWSDLGLNGNSYAAANTVFVNAKDLVDVTEITSYRSDADLIIQNMTTRSSDGEMRALSEMTVGMKYTGNDDHLWDEADYAVYFDQDYLNPERTVTRPSIELFAMNEDGYDVNPNEPLAGVYFAKLQFELNGEYFALHGYMDEDPLGVGREIVNYAQMLAAVQAALAELKADNPDNAALQTLQASLGDTFLADISPETGLQRVGTTIRISADGRTDGEDNVLTARATDLVLDPTEDDNSVENSNRYERAEPTPPEVGQVLAINVDLEKVGLAGDGGSLTVGSMFKSGDNLWSPAYAGKGIEQFNVTVYGGSDKPSSLASLQSTNNNLRVVTITTDTAQTGTYADLEIGNSNTIGYALKDVQIVDASSFLGDLSIEAGLTREVTAKYLDLEDVQTDPAGDNVDFVYTGGVGDDSFDVEIDYYNWEASGTATREDLTFHMDGGAGDDNLELSIVNGINLAADGVPGLAAIGFSNWYDNQKLNANLSIDGGDGDDTISTPGSGDVIIDAGAGNDTVYADNTGEMASWIFNTLTDTDTHNDLDDPQSDANDSYQIYNGKLTVSYRGYEVTVALPHTQGRVSDLQVNQAIKNAINNDAVLSQLLWAHDGPGNTLVVHASIDTPWAKEGAVLAPTDLTIELSAPTSLNASDVAQLSVAYGLPGSTQASLLAVMNASIDAFEAKGDYDNSDDQKISDEGVDTGGFSAHTSDNTITPGLGNDVIVLGTGANSNDTVVYEGFGNGTDTIVNFETDPEGVNFPITITPGSVARSESFTATFSELTLTPNTGGADITLNFTTPATLISLDNVGTDGSVLRAVDVAYAVFQAATLVDHDTNALTPDVPVVNGWILDWVEGTAQVKFSRVLTGNFDVDGGTAGDQDVTAANFVVAGATGGAVAISSYVDGTDAFVAGTPAKFQVDLNGSAAINNDTFVFSYDNDGAGAAVPKTVNIAYLAGDGPITLANKFVAALNGTGDWVATTNNDGIVNATRAVVGVLDVDTYVYPLNAAEITRAETNGLEIDVATLAGEDGTNQIGTAPVTQIIAHSDGLDYLDFSAYDAVAVIVNGVLVAGSTPTNGQEYVRMTESTTNDGEYTIALYTEAGATDTLVGTIGVADFGDYVETFVEENFIL